MVKLFFIIVVSSVYIESCIVSSQSEYSSVNSISHESGSHVNELLPEIVSLRLSSTNPQTGLFRHTDENRRQCSQDSFPWFLHRFVPVFSTSSRRNRISFF